jgi:hypothetical protein
MSSVCTTAVAHARRERQTLQFVSLRTVPVALSDYTRHSRRSISRSWGNRVDFSISCSLSVFHLFTSTFPVYQPTTSLCYCSIYLTLPFGSHDLTIALGSPDTTSPPSTFTRASHRFAPTAFPLTRTAAMVGKRHVRFASRSSKKSLSPTSKKKQAKHEVKEVKQQNEEQPRNSFSSSDTVLAPPIARDARALSSQHSAGSSETTLSACPTVNHLGDAAQHKSKEPEQVTEEQPRNSSGPSDTSLVAHDAHQSKDHKAALQR